MKFMVNRRRFMQGTSSVVAVGALSSVANRASAQSPGEVRVAVGAGDTGKATMEAYVKPFQTETGIRVIPINDDILFPALELMVSTKNVTADVVSFTQSAAFTLGAKGHLENIDYSIYRKSDLEGMSAFSPQPFCVPLYVFSLFMVYNTRKFPASKPRPTSWAEFWDAKKFPGVRVLRNGEPGSDGPFEEALLADGVPMNSLYPMDIDRVFASLDKIKPYIRRWFATGSEYQQIMRDGAADLAMGYDGRTLQLIEQGAPLEINRNQGKLGWANWVIPKGSPNAQSAQKFIEFTARADRQAAFSKLIAYGPTNLNAFKHLSDERGRLLGSHPDNLASSVRISGQWYSELGADGRSNTERLRERWKDWVLR